jgi:hypothetical protein
MVTQGWALTNAQTASLIGIQWVVSGGYWAPQVTLYTPSTLSGPVTVTVYYYYQ